MNTLFFNYQAHPILYQNLSKHFNFPEGKWTNRSFPDGETYLQFHDHLENKKIILLTSLNEPNPKILDLYFFAQTAKAQGAKSITLIAPYLPYLRQDKIFQEGESLTSLHFAKLISNSFDAIITVDPHLHRYHSLNEIYSISCTTLSASSLMAQWLKTHFLNHQAFLIGPDEESEQWVEEISKQSGLNYSVATKKRLGDRKVEIQIPNLEKEKDKIAILIDDVISSGHTLMECIQQLVSQGFKEIHCLATHALCSEENTKLIFQVGAKSIISTNSILHSSNQLDLSPLIANALTVDISK